MRKALLFFLCLMVAGIVSFYAGYHLYQSGGSKAEIEEQPLIGHGTGSDAEPSKTPYYLLKIEGDQLMVYEMPEKILYDSVKTESLVLQEKDVPGLLEGQEYLELTEVFEFLENCMS